MNISIDPFQNYNICQYLYEDKRIVKCEDIIDNNPQEDVKKEENSNSLPDGKEWPNISFGE